MPPHQPALPQGREEATEHSEVQEDAGRAGGPLRAGVLLSHLPAVRPWENSLPSATLGFLLCERETVTPGLKCRGDAGGILSSARDTWTPPMKVRGRSTDEVSCKSGLGFGLTVPGEEGQQGGLSVGRERENQQALWGATW